MQISRSDPLHHSQSTRWFRIGAQRHISPSPPLTTATISLELLQDCLGTLDQLATGITNLGVDAIENPTQSPRVRVLLEELLMSLQ